MGVFLRGLMMPVIRPMLKPATRFFVGLIAIPTFRLFLRRVVRLQDLDRELEKDLEEWFRGSVLLLIATGPMEAALFGWIPLSQGDWLLMAGRILLAISVIEVMPDQELFAVIHPGPPKLHYNRSRGLWGNLQDQYRPQLKGLLCQHLNRSSPVLAIMAVILTGTVAWVCYGLAILQYLIIGLVTSRDRALDVLGEFDRQVAIRRREIIDELHLDEAVERRDAAENVGRGAIAAATIANVATDDYDGTAPQSVAG